MNMIANKAVILAYTTPLANTIVRFSLFKPRSRPTVRSTPMNNTPTPMKAQRVFDSLKQFVSIRTGSRLINACLPNEFSRNAWRRLQDIIDPEETDSYSSHIPKGVGQLLQYAGCEVSVNSAHVEWISGIDSSEHRADNLKHDHNTGDYQLSSEKNEKLDQWIASTN